MPNLIDKKDFDILSKHLENHDIDKELFGGFSLITYAIYNQKKSLIKFLIKRGADVNAKCTNDYTALHHACFQRGGKSLKMVKYLIELGADLYAEDVFGRTAFNIACEYNQKYIVEYLGSLMLLN